MSESLLLIEDDAVLRKTLQLVLTQKGFEVEIANDGKSGLKKAYASSPDVVILDIMLPDMSGWEVCTRLREMSDVPIIMLTALGNSDDVVKGLDMGADDYLIKPVTAEELSARIRAVIRRVYGLNGNSGNNEPHQIYSYDRLAIDFFRREVTVDGRRIELTPIEYQLLSVLVRHQGRLLPHSFLLSQVWGSDYTQEIDYLRLYVSYLRRKIEKDPANPSLIHSEWGVGYRFG